jgi:hypothetical protein
VTGFGPIRPSRAHFRCGGCRDAGYPADAVLGLDTFLSRQARRLVCLSGGRHSFAEAERQLGEFLGWDVSDETIRRACLDESRLMAGWRGQGGVGAPVTAAAFQRAAGAIEFQTDAAKVNTTGGWRDVKIGVFARRVAGESATSEEWASRALPRSTVRVAFASIEPIDSFAPRWASWGGRLGVKDLTTITTLGDGAEWIWNAAAEQFPGGPQVLDIFHAAEHLAGAAKACWGEGSERAKAWAEAGREALLADGWPGLCDHLGTTFTAADAPAERKPFDDVLSYFAKHTERMNYAHRLHTGQSIGSGMVEGAAKTVVGSRLKQRGARWIVENVNGMAELCCLTYSCGWEAYWDRAA